ncbi:MAG TPA: hypothetical protein VHP30_02970, partial [Ignavibacteriales bacterium]|nr:hypothetical protein [Ignavibacteriales bacterium]
AYVNDNNIEDNDSKAYWKNIFQLSVEERSKEKILKHENSLKAINNDKNKYLKKTENVEKFFEKFFDVKVEKGQFESSVDYANRIKVDTSEIYYFEVGRITSNAEYDADKQHFSIYVSRDILLKRKEENLGTYVGQNAFNVKKEITKTSIKEYYFGLVGDVKNVEGEPLDKYCTIPCPVSKAKALSINMSARIGISLIGYRNSDVNVSHTKPTITAPEEILKSEYKIICNIKSLVIYDEKNNNILELYQK